MDLMGNLVQGVVCNDPMGRIQIHPTRSLGFDFGDLASILKVTESHVLNLIGHSQCPLSQWPILTSLHVDPHRVGYESGRYLDLSSYFSLLS